MAKKKPIMQELDFTSFDTDLDKNEKVAENDLSASIQEVQKEETLFSKETSFEQEPFKEETLLEEEKSSPTNSVQHDFSIDIFVQKNTEQDIKQPETEQPKEEEEEESPFHDTLPHQKGMVVKTIEPNVKNEKQLVAENEIVSLPKTNLIQSYKSRSNILIEKAKVVIVVNNDLDNSNALIIAKQLSDIYKEVDKVKKSLNKPLKNQIDKNNEDAKEITKPIEDEIARIKKLVTSYEVEKEKKRKEEERRVEEEKRKREELEKKEIERVSKITAEIQRLREQSAKSINSTTSIDDLYKIENSLISWTPKKEFFMEFTSDAEKLKTEIQSMIDGRKSIVVELDKERKKNEELRKKNKEEADKKNKELELRIAAEKKANEEREALKKIEAEAEEMSCRNEITILVASFGIRDIDGYIGKIINKYNSCKEAILRRDEIIENYHKEQDEKRRFEQLEAQKVKNLRTDYIFQVVDENKIPREYLCVDESKIKEAIKKNKASLDKDVNSFKIDGIIITTRVQTILK